MSRPLINTGVRTTVVDTVTNIDTNHSNENVLFEVFWPQLLRFIVHCTYRVCTAGTLRYLEPATDFVILEAAGTESVEVLFKKEHS